MMTQINYVEYQPRHAKAIADMWNRSSEGWLGRFWDSSEAKVLKEIENSSYLNIWLAMEGDDVIGYVLFCNYQEERGVAYIEMLNVLPSRHGQGIGKELVKRCVLRAAELGFNRIDLFTWPGNLKAMPLYKKCGFFWENMEANATHLMNFLPGLMKNELLKPWFEYFDWYDDLQRVLESVPDGRLEKGFEFYDYVWEKDEKKLEVTVEKRGRGIVRLATQDFEIQTLITESEPVFGIEYQAIYQVRNQSGKPLHLRLEGHSDSQVQHELDFEDEIQDLREISTTFFIDPIEAEASEWEALPGLCSKVTINGRSMELKTGLKINYPLNLKLSREMFSHLPGRPSRMFLNLENNFPVPCDFEINFPQDERVELQKYRHKIRLEAHEKSFLPLDFCLSAASIYAPQVEVKAYPHKGKQIVFNIQPLVFLPMRGSSHQLVIPGKFQLLNGAYTLFIWQTSVRNEAYFQSDQGAFINFIPPSIGMPYIDEFESEEPFSVEVSELGKANRLELKFVSKQNPGLEFALIYTLFPDGLLEYSLKILKLPPDSKLKALLHIGLESTDATYQSGGKIIGLEKDQFDAELESMPPLDADSNWFFSRSEDSTMAALWSSEDKLSLDRWWLAWEIDLKELYEKADKTAGPIRLWIDAFKTPNQLRILACNRYLKPETIHPTLELIINNGNPCVDDTYEAKLLQWRDSALAGEIILKNSSGDVLGKAEPSREENLREQIFNLTADGKKVMEKLSCDLAQPIYTLEREQVVLHSRNQIKRFVDESKPVPMLVLDNGCIKISAPKDSTLPSLVSLVHQEHEWLDSAFPNFEARGTSNPFLGGLYCIPQNIGLKDLQKDQHTADFSTLQDNWGNPWEGISIKTEVTSFEPLKGMIWKQHFLTRADLPVLIIQVEIVQGHGKAEFSSFKLYNYGALDHDISGCYLAFPDEKGGWQKIWAGRGRTYSTGKHHHSIIGSKNLATKLHLLCQQKIYRFFQALPDIMGQGAYFDSQLLDQVPRFTAPMALVFSEQSWHHEAFAQILALRFGEK